jgi:4-hydroxybenzoate polyprenyltransferase
MKVLKEAWEQVYGLLVEDGQIAIGTLVAFVAAFGWAAVAGEELRDSAGPLLFVLLMSLLLVNLYTTGRKASATRISH